MCAMAFLRWLPSLVLVVMRAGIASGVIPEHFVSTLPGLKASSDDPRLYSGYLLTPHANGTVKTHYMFVVTNVSLPTLVWQQGGPGGSSLIGFFTENGPYTLNDASTKTDVFAKTGVPTVFRNPHSWHRVANVLYVEHPAPTGFSYCDPGPCYWTDETQADTSYLFYQRFFAHGAYHEFAANGFYISGESYAGVLVPTVAKLILAGRTDANRHQAPFNLGGIALGNDCPGYGVYTCTPYSGWLGTQVALEFRFRHGMISEELYGRINAACAGQWGTFEPPATKLCRDLLEDPVRPCLSKAGDTYEMGGGYYLYDTCASDLLALSPTDHAAHGKTINMSTLLARPRRELVAPAAPPPFPNDAGPWTYACGQEAASTAWLNLEAVREALHVQTKAESGRDFAFSTGLNYTHTAFSLVEDYSKVLLPDIRVLQYSGDADPCVPHIGTERWISSLELPVAEPWRPWTAATAGGVAGYVTTYLSAEHNNTLTYATVRDAGHMVPRYKGAEAYHMISRFLNAESL